jgi:hypothetical protein
MNVDHIFGLDCGKLVDHSALAVFQRHLLIGPYGFPVLTSRGHHAFKFDLVALRRFPKKTPYPEVVRHTVNAMKLPDIRGPRLALDCTGVGVAILELFDAALADWTCTVPIVITGGQTVTRKGRRFGVPKTALASALLSALEEGVVRFVPGLEHGKLLRDELQAFQVRMTQTGRDTFGAEAGAHDDLVLAVMLAVWLGTQPWLKPRSSDLQTPAEAEAIAAAAESYRRGETYQARRARELEQSRRAELDKAAQADPFDPIWWETP